MKELVRSAFQWLADTRLARRVVDTLFRSKARRRIVELDRQSLARCQSRTLLGLVHKGHSRDSYAKGAVAAAKFLVGKPPGSYSMADVLGL